MTATSTTDIWKNVVAGPKITWDASEVRRTVEKYGQDEAVKVLAGKQLDRDYVSYIVTKYIENDYFGH